MSLDFDPVYEEKYKEYNFDSGLNSPKLTLRPPAEESEYEYCSEDDTAYMKSEYLLSDGFDYMEDEIEKSIRKRKNKRLNPHLLGY